MGRVTEYQVQDALGTLQIFYIEIPREITELSFGIFQDNKIQWIVMKGCSKEKIRKQIHKLYPKLKGKKVKVYTLSEWHNKI